jgi:hypothetical protein
MKSLISVFAAATLLSACASGSAPGLIKTQNVIATPAQVTTAQPVSSIVQLTNGVTETNWATNLVTSQITNWTTNIVYAVNPTITNTLNIASQINGLAGPANPFSGWTTLALGAVTAGLGWYAKIKTAQAAKNGSVGATLITAIEGLPDALGQPVKAAVQAQALQSGTSNEVHDVVQSVTNPSSIAKG